MKGHIERRVSERTGRVSYRVRLYVGKREGGEGWISGGTFARLRAKPGPIDFQIHAHYNPENITQYNVVPGRGAPGSRIYREDDKVHHASHRKRLGLRSGWRRLLRYKES